ncbi:MAG: NUDIX hydrolase [Candidatus Nomurabacteria bacterium]|jgi:8-oxo-dGTP pyrophosphatase MutT (NUDIX family)|nr:NUDIX hydrolase [Candidatus Nomurabacteria bacterium]
MRVLESAPIKQKPDKARAIIFDREQNVVVVDYDGCLMFPGGKLDDGEIARTAVTREVKEELGLIISDGQKLFTFRQNRKNYPERDGTITPQRLVETDYFLFYQPIIEFGERQLTNKEKLGKVVVKKVRLGKLLNFITEHQSDNERWPFFEQEIMTVAKRLVESAVQLEEMKY